MNLLNKILDQIDSTPLSISVMSKLTNNSKIHLFHELKNINVSDYDYIISIILDKHNFGHYVIFIKTINNNWELYESYGMSLPELLRTFNYSGIRISEDDIYKTFGNNLKKNNIKHQSKKLDITTCGMHISNRYYWKHLDNNKYNEFMRSVNSNLDNFVILTNLNMFMDLMNSNASSYSRATLG